MIPQIMKSNGGTKHPQIIGCVFLLFGLNNERVSNVVVYIRCIG